MRPFSADLADFLEVVGKVASGVADSPEPLSNVRGALDSAGLLALAVDTADEPDALTWLAHTVRVAADASPSLGYVLAARYTAQRALGAATDAREPVFALTDASAKAVVPTLLAPDAVVVLDVTTLAARVAPWEAVAGSAAAQERTGLRGARLRTVDLPKADELPDGGGVLREWDVLTGAALAGLARRAARCASEYANERHQFGASIGSFMGMRALLADMTLKVDAVEALLDAALESGAATERVSASAGRMAVEVCIDAIQTHGGYGYIDEYPLVGLIRDAISLQARAGGRRLHVARVADVELGPRGGSVG